uniref:Uncharacterized protein n=1 Tax=Arundo donax TaxID=35708 RepID=A0A0A9FLM6_ARUDO
MLFLAHQRPNIGELGNYILHFAIVTSDYPLEIALFSSFYKSKGPNPVATLNRKTKWG